jgi:hypothetical protein
MDFSRRWFLKSAVMAAVATQLPISLPEGQKVLFIDGAAHVVSNVKTENGVIRAKVVNGAWDLVVDTNTKMMYAYSNPAYGYDHAEFEHGLQHSTSYSTLLEIEVPHSVGEVSEDMKPRKVRVQKFVEQGHPGSEWVQGVPVIDLITGEPLFQSTLVPSMVEVTRMFGSPDGEHMTFTSWEKEYEEVEIDPLHGAGMDYEAIIEAANRKRMWA